jgi:RHS repeat-associated protein
MSPYGELWIEQVSNSLEKLPFRFTGKELDPETGFYYYGARYLNPKTSMWISADPAMTAYIDGKSKSGGIYNIFNMYIYSYTNNNPVNYIDPDGREPDRYKYFNVSEQEYAVISSHPRIRAIAVIVNARSASAYSERNYPGLSWGTKSDAFRHAYWAARNTMAMGTNLATEFTDAHEYSSDSIAADIYMDIHNNAVGIEIGNQNPNASFEELSSLIQQSVENGEMLMMKPLYNSEGRFTGEFDGNLYRSNDTDYKNPIPCNSDFIRRSDASQKIADEIGL